MSVCNKTISTYLDGTQVLRSYGKVVAIRHTNGDVEIMAKYYKYSITTSRHLSQFLNSDSKTIEQNIKNGVYTLID